MTTKSKRWELKFSTSAAALIWPLVVSVSFVRRQDDFKTGSLEGWRVKEGTWNVRDGRLVAEGGFSVLLRQKYENRDLEASSDVGYSHNEAHVAAGILVRFKEDMTGYAVCLRDIEKAVDPKFGPWERPVLQLFRLDRDRWNLLQESKVMNCRSDVVRRIKVVCRGPYIWVFYEDMKTPVLKERDAVYDRTGLVGLWKDQRGKGLFENFTITGVRDEPSPPLAKDWSWVRGAVYVRSNAVNSVQMWHDYWDHTALIDRELSYAACYGFNMVQVYLHWIVWDHHKGECLKRIEDFLARAAGHGLKVNLILWDDCGHVEPSLTFAEPVRGRHNSQMMPNPSHKIRDSEAELDAHKDRFREYIEGVVGRFKNDPRISFWQIYNECMGPKEQYRTGKADANLNRLLEWTRAWVKGAGTDIPITATGGGFYGPKYSDFYSYHSYRFGKAPLPNTDGGPEHLCTETLNRPDCGLVDCLQGIAARRNGLVVWELMIGRDNCRFPWGNPDGPGEPPAPFHGVVYPDGHPWDIREVEALLGQAGFASLKQKVFEVEYFDGEFAAPKKSSITPRIDLGSGSPDASAGIGGENFSVRWTGRLVAPDAGIYTFFGESDGALAVWIGDEKIIDKTTSGRAETQGRTALERRRAYRVKAEYVHRSGEAANRVSWSGPGFEKRVLRLDGK